MTHNLDFAVDCVEWLGNAPVQHVTIKSLHRNFITVINLDNRIFTVGTTILTSAPRLGKAVTTGTLGLSDQNIMTKGANTGCSDQTNKQGGVLLRLGDHEEAAGLEAREVLGVLFAEARGIGLVFFHIPLGMTPRAVDFLGERNGSQLVVELAPGILADETGDGVGRRGHFEEKGREESGEQEGGRKEEFVGIVGDTERAEEGG